MTSRVFLDTNVLVYATLQTDARSEIARSLLRRGGTISVQVLNEFVNVAHRKLRRSWQEIDVGLRAVRTLCPTVAPLTIATHEAAIAIAGRTGYALYDALVIASALNTGCDVLLSEDLQDGQTIDGQLTIRNPFNQLERR